jgi:hypothetical protein
MQIKLLDQPFPFTPPIERSEGVHLSDIITDLGREVFGTKGANGPTTEEMQLQWEKGFVWEEALSHGFGNRLAQRPGEIVCDGIACSPDGVGMDEEGEVVVEEYKCTALSSTKTPDGIWRWRTQAAAYCYVMGATRAVFRVFYINGDYRGSGPLYRVFQLDWSGQEIEENWAMLVNHAKRKGMLKWY